MLSYRRGLVGYRLVLIGIGVSAAMTAAIQYLLTRATIFEASQATVWLTGSLNGRSWEHVRPVAVGADRAGAADARRSAASCACSRWATTRPRVSASRVERSRLALILCAVGLAALATASAGPVAFVAFFAPVIARRLVGRGQLALVPSMLMGSAVVLASDLIAPPDPRPDRAARGRRHVDHRRARTCCTCCGPRTIGRGG